MVAGDPHGLEGAYRRYADRLHAYARSMLKDGDAASDVVHDTFLIASQRAGDLRDPERLQAWLYTITRRECLRVLRAGRRGAPLGDADEPVAEPVDPTRAVQAAEIRELVQTAAAGLSESDREMIELSVRHELSPADVGSVLGLSANHAHARMSRARAQLHRSLGALLVARAGGARCHVLAELTRGWDGNFTPLLRKRVSRHVEKCSRCAESQRELLNPAALLPAYAALPFLPVPALLWSRLEASQAGAGQAMAGPAPDGPSTQPPDGSPTTQPVGTSPPTLPMPTMAHAPLPTGMARAPLPTSMAKAPPPTAVAQDRRLPVAAAAAALALLVLAAGAGVLWWLGGFDPAPAAAPGSTVPAIAAATDPVSTSPAAPSTDPVVSQTPTPAQSSTAPTPVAFTVTAEAEFDCLGSLFRISVAAESNLRLDTALLYWSAPATHRVEMTLTGPRTAEGQTAPIIVLEPSVAWWVEAKATDGRQAKTAPVAVDDPCP